MKWLENLTLTKLFLILVILLAGLHLVHPPTAEWTITHIMVVVEAMRDFYGDIS